MPKENKKRGRRAEKKQKENVEIPIEEEYSASKRRKVQDDNRYLDVERNALDEVAIISHMPAEAPFYGLLDEEEQEYFKKADSMLELNQFENAEERHLFLENVYKEAAGKELKLANSQSCSRLMERLILLSNPPQLKVIFEKFDGHLPNLLQHRFASHCCEILFRKAAEVVSEEMKAVPFLETADSEISMENLFLKALAEIEMNLGYLMTDTFASHPLRILLIIFSGLPLDSSPMQNTLQSKRKEGITVANEPSTAKMKTASPRIVPSSFESALLTMFTKTLMGLDTSYLRAMATQPVSNPVLQILLEIELTRSGAQSAKNAQSLLRKLLPDDPLIEGTESANFVQGLLYDPIGSRLLEIIVSHAPGKIFKSIYRGLWRDRLGNIVKNETAAFVMIKLLQRLGKEDLEAAVQSICLNISVLIERKRTAIIKTLIERCRARDIDQQPIATALREICISRDKANLLDMLGLMISSESTQMSDERQKQLEGQMIWRTHASLLAQSMLESPGPLRDLVNEAILTLAYDDLVRLAKNNAASRILQLALTCTDQSLAFRRTFTQTLLTSFSTIPDTASESFLSLATDPISSHFIDSLWPGTANLKFLRERIATILLHHEAELRESYAGRAIWRNWKMDLYKVHSRDWGLAAASGPDTALTDVSKSKSSTHMASTQTKSALQIARERHVKQQQQQQQQGKERKKPTRQQTSSIATGANAEESPASMVPAAIIV